MLCMFSCVFLVINPLTSLCSYIFVPPICLAPPASCAANMHNKEEWNAGITNMTVREDDAHDRVPAYQGHVSAYLFTPSAVACESSASPLCLLTALTHGRFASSPCPCLLSFVFCLLSFVFCLLSFVFCLFSFVFCLLSLSVFIFMVLVLVCVLCFFYVLCVMSYVYVYEVSSICSGVLQRLFAGSLISLFADVLGLWRGGCHHAARRCVGGLFRMWYCRVPAGCAVQNPLFPNSTQHQSRTPKTSNWCFLGAGFDLR